MFQTFAVSSSPEQGPPRLAALRGALAEAGLHGFLVPRADVHQGEYVAPRDARLEWLTGFTGSAGFCAVLENIAGVFIDGRYRVQVRSQVADTFTPVHWPEVQLADWLLDHLPDGGIVGFDPWLHTVDELASLTRKLRDSKIVLRPVDNMIDPLWSDQPAAPTAPFTAHPLELSGEAHDAKRTGLAADLKAACTVITLPDSIAWLLNIRGTDIERNPVPHAFAILHDDARVTLFAGQGKADAIADHLGPMVTVAAQDSFAAHLGKLTGTVQIDPKSCPAAVATILTKAGATISHASDPCVLPKATKNATEIAGAKAAQHRDAVAMVQFLAWLDAEAPKGHLTEIDVVQKLEGFRTATNALRDISFETISGAGPNAAIVHYRVTDDTNRAVNAGELLLVDSGGQYRDGTTDITRTISIGQPTDEHRACYTRVLRGMVAISRLRFPKGLSGQHIDAFARAPLWEAGLDYDHGTGHGIGSYLSVHEGPQGISRRATTPFVPGMIVSNEPGYYREGAFGIRIENLIAVVEAPAIAGGDSRDMLAFETLTYVPLDRRLIETDQLTRAERDWIDRYHATTLAVLAQDLHGDALDWLQQACAPLT
ncbi:aminopeptidase P family protein [Yoonia sp. 208BN28-4]|uniref:aminopeptidase P family protein n=1 Tax=Yoonia sp. 208BN28-4 TaxID=3126505 RepID=UPI0030A3692A